MGTTMKLFIIAAFILSLGQPCATISSNNTVDVEERPAVRPIRTGQIDVDGNLRIIHLEGNINNDTPMAIQAALLIVEKDPQTKRVLIEINSSGGLVEEGFVTSKLVEHSKMPINCLVDGEADSMAFYILQSCKIRIMTKRSILMIHGPSIQFDGHSNWRNIARRLQALERAMMEHMSTRLNISTAELNNRIGEGKEMWLTWEDALKLHAIDYVVDNAEAARLHLITWHKVNP